MRIKYDKVAIGLGLVMLGALTGNVGIIAMGVQSAVPAIVDEAKPVEDPRACRAERVLATQ